MTFIRDLYKEDVVGLEWAPALVPDHWDVIPSLKKERQECKSSHINAHHLPPDVSTVDRA